MGMKWMAKRTTVLLLCVFAIALSGCPSKKAGSGTGEDGTGGLGSEEGLTGSSLSRAQKGLGPEEDGILKDIHFGYDSSEIDSGERGRLDQNVAWLRDNPRAKIVDKVVTQSSDREFHCLSITIFYEMPA